MATVGLGIDVGKAAVDAATTDGRVKRRFARTDKGLSELLAELKEAGVEVSTAVLEASGGYELAVLKALHAGGIPVVRVQPARARSFALGMGKRAKTDAIDAAVLARMAEVGVDGCPRWTPPTDDETALRELVLRRQQVLVDLDAEQKRLEQAVTPVVQKDIGRHVAVLKKREAALRKQIDNVLRRSPLGAQAKKLEAVKGVGRITAVTLLVTVPELGELGRREVAALVGVAPMNRDSGMWKGQRFSVGGRSAARKAVYMAALVATRHNEVIGTFYQRLKEKGKPAKVALVACMRKLLIHLNGLLRDPATSPHTLPRTA